MNSLTSTAYGSRVRRQGRSRPCRANHSDQRGLEGGPVFWFLEPRPRFPCFPCRCHLSLPLPRPLTTAQADKLRGRLAEMGFEFLEKALHALRRAEGQAQPRRVRSKGPKVLVQGKETEDFVKFTLEPEILGEAKLGYEEVLAPEKFEPHFGIDESGKGDFFGPLVIAGRVRRPRPSRAQLIDAGVQDSKRIGSDAKIRSLAQIIKTTARRGAQRRRHRAGPLQRSSSKRCAT